MGVGSWLPLRGIVPGILLLKNHDSSPRCFFIFIIFGTTQFFIDNKFLAIVFGPKTTTNQHRPWASTLRTCRYRPSSCPPPSRYHSPRCSFGCLPACSFGLPTFNSFSPLVHLVVRYYFHDRPSDSPRLFIWLFIWPTDLPTNTVLPT